MSVTKTVTRLTAGGHVLGSAEDGAKMGEDGVHVLGPKDIAARLGATWGCRL